MTDGPWTRGDQAEQAQEHRCADCLRVFKRVEHLRRHRRSHESHRNYVCARCNKAFARSDILRRHEATHDIVPRSPGSSKKRRACRECARLRERCDRDDPCARCVTKSMSCVYPMPTRGSLDTSQRSLGVVSETLDLETGSPQEAQQRSDSQTDTYGLSRIPIGHLLYNGDFPAAQQENGLSPEVPLVGSFVPTGMRTDAGPDLLPIETPDLRQLSQQDASLDHMMDLPLNWLPTNDALSLDYDSILGLGLRSVALPSPPSDYTMTGNPFASPTDTTIPSSWREVQTVPNAAALGPSQVIPSIHIHESMGISPCSSDNATSIIPSTYQSSMDTASPGSTQGDLYATSSDGARAPCTVRFKNKSHVFIPGTTPLQPLLRPKGIANSYTGMGFTNIGHLSTVHYNPDQETRALDIGVYQIILESFSKLCLSSDNIFTRFQRTDFPTHEHFGLFIHLYYAHFDPILPVVHREVTNENHDWLLALAIAAVGCQYTETQEFSQCIEPMHEFLRRALLVESEAYHQSQHLLPLKLSMILSQIGMTYSGLPWLAMTARTRHASILEVLHEGTHGGKTSCYERMGSGSVSSSAHERVWRRALVDEAGRRISHCITLLDRMGAYHFDKRLSPPNICDLALPNDQLWATRTSSDWASMSEADHQMPSLSQAVVKLFREKKIDSRIGEFGQLILMHGIYQEIHQVNNYSRRALGSWTPSFQRAPDEGVLDNATALMARARSHLNSWRNAALDCIDVLHWQANATIARLAGGEHSTVFHLHFSRVVLLVPVEKLRILASSLASLSKKQRDLRRTDSTRQATLDAEREVLEWAQRDEHKARLAVLHSGTLFWHVRRYSRRAFYEPISIYLATLTIWAYSSYVSRASPATSGHDLHSIDGCRSGSITRQSSPENGPESRGDRDSTLERETEPEPTFVRLDRPNDDEMVQLFVRSGRPSKMRAHITGVGNIYDQKGPVRMLREGQKLLNTVSTAWGRSQEYMSTMEMLAEVTSKKDCDLEKHAQSSI